MWPQFGRAAEVLSPIIKLPLIINQTSVGLSHSYLFIETSMSSREEAELEKRLRKACKII
jgi:hypothetical protein